MSKHIKYSARLLQQKGVVHVTIVSQTHIREEFSHKGEDFFKSFYFRASNGVRLRSFLHPEFNIESGEISIALRGDHKHRDHDILVIPLQHYQKFKEAVLEYNSVFA